MTAVFTGAGAVVLAPGETCDPSPWLRVRKTRKYMGLQDDLAVVATARALEAAGIETPLGARAERTGLFLAVGYIPFLEADIGPVLEASTSDGAFDVRRFGAGGYQRAHPLLTFRCLPNMPAYHVSTTFDVQGPYVVTYPGPAQLYAALEEACAALADGRIDVALVGGVAAQSNFLVRHHFERLDPPTRAEDLKDAAGVIVLETAALAGHRARGTLDAMAVDYTPPEVLAPGRATTERVDDIPIGEGLGPAALAIALAKRGDARALRHDLESRDGVRATSTWSFA